MRVSTEKLFLALIVVVIAAISIILAYTLYVNEKPATDEVMTFLQEVVSIDVSKYNVTTFNSTVTYPDWLNGQSQLTGKCTLDSETNKLDVLYKFRGGTLSWCLVRNLESQPHYTTAPSTDVGEVASVFLQKYQAYSDDSDLETMKNMLNAVNVAENSTQTEGNLKLIVSVTSFSTSFDWRYTVNGTESSRLYVSFRDGEFYTFSADKSIY